ncbi:MAG TPA: hypothetical protein VNG33_18185 [Polyangiaceae bacterium]|nr:hypothetical protein [Polyangiaceae bacterium]
MNYRKSVLVGFAGLALCAVGCSSGRDVEVSGKVTAPSTLAVGDKLVIDFIDVVGDGTDAKQHLASSAELKAPGEFDETVSLEGDQVLVRAIDDRDGDGKCTAGEAWGEAHVAVMQNKADAATLMLVTAPCPAEPTE